MRIKSCDYLFTTGSVVPWCEEKQDQIKFEIPGCILLLLFIRGGLGFYPKFSTAEVLQLDTCKSGWNEGFEKLKTTYSKILKQTSPQASYQTRGASIDTSHLVMDVTDWFAKRKRPRID